MRILIPFVTFVLISFQSIGRDTLVAIKVPKKILKRLNGEAKFSVFLFFSPECPLCGNYTRYLNDLYSNYHEKGIDFTYIFAPPFSPKQIEAFRNSYKLKGNIVKDRKKKYMQAFQATTTPEVFVLDDKKQLVYSGAIDNRAYEIGRLRKVVTEEYLNSVIDSMLHKEVVPYNRVSPIGCLLEQ